MEILVQGIIAPGNNLLPSFRPISSVNFSFSRKNSFIVPPINKFTFKINIFLYFWHKYTYLIMYINILNLSIKNCYLSLYHLLANFFNRYYSITVFEVLSCQDICYTLRNTLLLCNICYITLQIIILTWFFKLL